MDDRVGPSHGRSRGDQRPAYPAVPRLYSPIASPAWESPATPTDAKPGTVHAYGRAVRHFFNWLVDEELIARNPMVGSRAGRARVPLPHVPDPQIVPFTEEQIERLLAACDLGTKLGLRNAAIGMLMLDTGLRSSEVCRIRLDDYNPVSGVLQVQSAKGGSERTAVLSPASRRAVNRWLVQGRQIYGNPPDRLFISLIGREPDALTPNGLGQIIRELGKAAGISGVRCSPHTLRHTFACFYLLNGGDIESLRQFMGHSTISRAACWARRSIVLMPEPWKMPWLILS